jgi:acyl-CoA synthetase (AMP-forming)/AMP-acid ligase II
MKSPATKHIVRSHTFLSTFPNLSLVDAIQTKHILTYHYDFLTLSSVVCMQIPEYRIPHYIPFANSFPRSAVGKVLKPKLLEILLEEIGGNNRADTV